MNATEQEKAEMNTATTTNQRLVTILLVLLIVFVVLLIIGTVAGWLMMGGGMTLAPRSGREPDGARRPGAHLPRAQVPGSAGVGGMMGMNGQMMNNLMSACTDMMRNFQNP